MSLDTIKFTVLQTIIYIECPEIQFLQGKENRLGCNPMRVIAHCGQIILKCYAGYTSRVCITVSNSPNPPCGKMRLCKKNFKSHMIF